MDVRSASRPGRFTSEETAPVTIEQEAVWAPGSVWKLWSREKSCPCRESYSGHPARHYTDWAIPALSKHFVPIGCIQKFVRWDAQAGTRIMNAIMKTRLRSKIQSCHGLKKKNSVTWVGRRELYRPSDRRLSAKLVPTLADRGCRVVSATNPSQSLISVF
jgi:hypothetical protein